MSKNRMVLIFVFLREILFNYCNIKKYEMYVFLRECIDFLIGVGAFKLFNDVFIGSIKIYQISLWVRKSETHLYITELG